jgi:hypothetical protein
MNDVPQPTFNSRLIGGTHLGRTISADALRTDLGLGRTWFVQLNITNCLLTKAILLDRATSADGLSKKLVFLQIRQE